MAKILLVEDEHDLSMLIKDWLESESHLVEWVEDGLSALNYLTVNSYDLAILDIMLPHMNGVDVCRRHKQAGGETKVLMLTAKSCVEDKEIGLDAGADDYLTKPFHLKELSARIRVLLRRPVTVATRTMQVNNIVLDTVTREVTKDGEAVHLLPKEFRLLEFLMRHPNQVFSAEALLHRVWESDTSASLDTVRGHIMRLRGKLDQKGHPNVIHTLRGLGYKLESK
jgi:two-component system response regulator MprA